MTTNTPPNPFNPTNLTSKKVDQYHTKDDVDSSYGSHHHTLGWSVNQAASGFDVKKALDSTEQNFDAINQLITDLNATIADLQEQTAILDKVGKRWERLASGITNVPNAAAAPYTALSGFNVHEGDTFAEVGLEYTGAGVFTCLESGSFNFEVAINWAGNPTNRRVLFANLNSVASGANSYYRFTIGPSNSAVWLQFHKFDIKLAVNDTLRFAIFQDSGGILATSTADGIQRVSGSYASMVGVTRILGQ